MCLACAIPVRGRTLGVECLAAALGEDAPVAEVAGREPGAAMRSLGRVAFAVGLAATMLPWSRFGPGSHPFGAWSSPPRWSMLAAVSALASLLISAARPLDRAHRRAWDVAAAVAGILLVTGSVLALVRPPDFASPWLGPWVALGAGVLGSAASLEALRRSPDREPTHV
jgi:hypothetical protein